MSGRPYYSTRIPQYASSLIQTPIINISKDPPRRRSPYQNSPRRSRASPSPRDTVAHGVDPRSRANYPVLRDPNPAKKPTIPFNANPNAKNYNHMLKTPKNQLARKYHPQQLIDLEQKMGGPQNFIQHFNLTPAVYDFLMRKPPMDEIKTPHDPRRTPIPIGQRPPVVVQPVPVQGEF